MVDDVRDGGVVGEVVVAEDDDDAEGDTNQEEIFNTFFEFTIQSVKVCQSQMKGDISTRLNIPNSVFHYFVFEFNL